MTPRDYRLLRTIERLLGSRITRKRLPSLADLAARRREATKEAVTAAVAAGDLDPYLVLAGELGDELDPVEVAAAALCACGTRRAPGRPRGRPWPACSARRAAEEQAGQRRTRRARPRRADGQAPEAGMRRLFVTAGAGGRAAPPGPGRGHRQRGGDPRAGDRVDRHLRPLLVRRGAGGERAAGGGGLGQTTLRGRRVGARLADEGDEQAEIGEQPARSERGRPFRPGAARGARPAGRSMRPAPSARPPRPGGAPGRAGGRPGRARPDRPARRGADRPFQPYRSDRPADRRRTARAGRGTVPRPRPATGASAGSRGTIGARGTSARPSSARRRPRQSPGPRRSAPGAPGTTRLRRRPRPSGSDGDPGI